MPYAAVVNMVAIDLPERLMRSDTIYQELGELIEDIAQNGLINPISVREIGEGRYRLIAGHRRFLATKELGRAGIPAMVYAPDEGDDDLIMGSENFQRVQVDPVEEAEFYAAQIAKFGISASEVARRYKRSPAHVLQSLSLLSGDPEVLAALRAGAISKSQAAEINKFQDDTGLKTALRYACNNGMTATAIRDWRQSRENTGVSETLRQVEPTIMANGEMLMETRLMCSFCRKFHTLDIVQTLQICSGCFSELGKAAEVYNTYERLQKEEEERAAKEQEGNG